MTQSSTLVINHLKESLFSSQFMCIICAEWLRVRFVLFKIMLMLEILWVSTVGNLREHHSLHLNRILFLTNKTFIHETCVSAILQQRLAALSAASLWFGWLRRPAARAAEANAQDQFCSDFAVWFMGTNCAKSRKKGIPLRYQWVHMSQTTIKTFDYQNL